MSHKNNCSNESIPLSTNCDRRTSHHSHNTKQSLIVRLNKIEGQVRGIKGMIEKDTYCDDVLVQIAAIQSAIKSVSTILLENHMKNCIVQRVHSGEDEVIDDLLETIKNLMK